MKRAIIGAAFFIGGAILTFGGLAIAGLIIGAAGLIIMIFELLTKDKE